MLSVEILPRTERNVLPVASLTKVNAEMQLRLEQLLLMIENLSLLISRNLNARFVIMMLMII